MNTNKGNSKLRTILVLNLLRNNTDDNASISLSEIMDELNSHGLTADRKSIYDDFAVLNKAGFSIEKKYGKTVTYYLKNNRFRSENVLTPSIIFLTSPFFSRQKSIALTKALLANSSQESSNVIFSKLLKIIKNDEKDYIEILSDIIKNAYEEKKVFIETADYSGNVSIYNIFITDNQLYLVIGAGNLKDNISFISLDSVMSYKLTDIRSVPSNTYIPNFDVNEYVYDKIEIKNSKKYDIELIINEDLILEFIERFVTSSISENLKTHKISDEDFKIDLRSTINSSLIEYIFKHNDRIKIVSPECLKEKMNRIQKFISKEF